MDRRIRKEKFINTLIRSPFSYVVLFLFSLIFSISAISTYKKSRIAKQKTDQVESELSRLLKQEENLRDSLEDMNTEYGMEKALREKFGIVKEGETAVIIIDPKEEDVPEEDVQKPGIFNFLRNIF